MPGLVAAIERAIGAFWAAFDGAFPLNLVLYACCAPLLELLFIFRIGRLSAPVRIGGAAHAEPVEYALLWDHASSAAECLQVASDSWRLSNCGVVAFDLEVCNGSNGEGAANASAACDVPTITLRNCLLDADSFVVPRTSGGHRAVSTAWGGHVAGSPTGRRHGGCAQAAVGRGTCSCESSSGATTERAACADARTAGGCGR